MDDRTTPLADLVAQADSLEARHKAWRPLDWKDTEELLDDSLGLVTALRDALVESEKRVHTGYARIKSERDALTARLAVVEQERDGLRAEVARLTGPVEHVPECICTKCLRAAVAFHRARVKGPTNAAE